MSRRLRQQRQLFPCLLANPNSSLAAQRHQPLQPLILPFASHHHMIETPPPSLDRLFNRVHSIQNFHS
jgi:hypothetical protein